MMSSGFLPSRADNTCRNMHTKVHTKAIIIYQLREIFGTSQTNHYIPKSFDTNKFNIITFIISTSLTYIQVNPTKDTSNQAHPIDQSPSIFFRNMHTKCKRKIKFWEWIPQMAKWADKETRSSNGVEWKSRPLSAVDRHWLLGTAAAAQGLLTWL